MVQSLPGFNPKPRFGPILDSTVHFISIQTHVTSVLSLIRSMLEVRRPLLGQPGLARPHQHIYNGPWRYLYTVESTEGISDIWFCESFPRWGFLILRVRVRFTYGSEFTRIQSETPLWSNSGFDGPFHFSSNACHIRSNANSHHARGTPTTSRSAWSGQATPPYTQRAAAIPVYPFQFNSISCHIRSNPNAQHARGTPTTSRSAWSGQATPAYTQRAAADSCCDPTPYGLCASTTPTALR